MTGPQADRIAESAPSDPRSLSTARPELGSLAAAGAPVALGLMLAFGTLAALRAGLPEAVATWVAALAGASAWVYLGFGLRQGPWMAAANVLVAAALFTLAVLARGTDASSIAPIVFGHAAWGLVLAWKSRQDPEANTPVWIGWSSFHATLAFLLLGG